MRALLLALLFLPLPALAQAQGLFDGDGEPVPWPEPRRYAAPVVLRTDSVQVEPGVVGVAVYVEGVDGERGTAIGSAARPPVRVIHWKPRSPWTSGLLVHW
jgi:hypothetical protein